MELSHDELEQEISMFARGWKYTHFELFSGFEEVKGRRVALSCGTYLKEEYLEEFHLLGFQPIAQNFHCRQLLIDTYKLQVFFYPSGLSGLTNSTKWQNCKSRSDYDTDV